MPYNPFSLEGKTILVTGASSGIGRATAIECSKMGANVIITARCKERLASVFNNLDTTIGQQHQMIIADMNSPEGVKDLIEQIPEIDGLSSNVGISLGSVPIKFISEEAIEEVWQVNTAYR